MESLWRYMLVILILAKFVAPQCVGSEVCDCHCYCCTYPGCITTTSRYCTSCAKGWSGIIGNLCQRQNVAYYATAFSTSTSNNYIARNAVDEDSGTYALTDREKNPRLTLTLSNVFKIRNIYLRVYAFRNSIYDVFVTNSASTAPSDDNKCISVPVNAGNRFEGNAACNKILTGDQIVIQIASTSDTLLVFEVKVYQCSQGTYGDLCEFECRNCVNNRCDGYTGVCESGCNNGWQGEKCDVNCNSNCEYKTCNQDTGFCAYGCENGWYGGTCNRLCPSKCESPCDRSLGCTNCQIGYNGPDCNKCDDNTYGKNCSMTCQNCEDCNNVDGCTSCREGWSGRLCICSENCENENCNDNGICQSGCKGSYHGERCDVPCPSRDCQRCDQLSGNCTECSEGLYGINCTEKCSGSCLGGSCNMTGTCLKGCKNGFNGIFCTKTHSSTLTERARNMNIRKLQIENLRLDNEKLQKEIQKLEVETDVLKVKENYYKIKLRTIKKEHPKVAAQVEKNNLF